MNIEQLEKEIQKAQTYFNFWSSNRHLPRAAETADYFASRLKELRDKHDKQSNTCREHRAAARVKDN